MMSSVANNHDVFVQQSLISRAAPNSLSPSPPSSQASFYKREPPNSNCPLPMRSRQPPEFPSWSANALFPSPQWIGEVACDTTTPHIGGGLPAAHSLLNFPKSSPSVITNQNDKSFSATPSSGNYQNTRLTNPYEPVSSRAVDYPYTNGMKPRREDCQLGLSGGYPLSASSGSLSTPPCNSAFSETNNPMIPMDFIDGRSSMTSDPNSIYHQTSKTFQSSIGGEEQFAGAFRPSGMMPDVVGAGSDTPRTSVSSTNGFVGAPRKTTPNRYAIAPASTGGSPIPSLASSDGETTASSSATRGTKRTRKPAPTLATGRRNLKSEPVDPDEADRRLKRRERNRKSAQKCRERKLYRTQELQSQVEGLNIEANRLMRENDRVKEHARCLIRLLQQHCPGVAIPYTSCISEPVLAESAGYLRNDPSQEAGLGVPLFCDLVEPVDTYKAISTTSGSSGFNFDTISGANSNWSSGRSTFNSTSSASEQSPQLPPMSHLIPASLTSRRHSTTRQFPSRTVMETDYGQQQAPSIDVTVKPEEFDWQMMNNWCNKTSVSGLNKSLTFPEANPGDRDTWKLMEDTDSSPSINEKKTLSASI